MSDLIRLKIDGQELTCEKGVNVLEAAKQIGAPISYFCYHPGLSSPAVCRQCLVEVKGQPKLVPSCYTPVAENMEVLTQSEKVLTARQQMLEFTLANHPVDCPICDKAGECTLQKMYSEWDGSHSRIDMDKKHKPKVKDLGPHIVLDAERCILCTRCIRVCNEVAKDPQLTMAWRGDREQLTTSPGEQLDNPYSINTVDVCPVGALTSKDFRFSMRAWELYTTPSVCTGCATGCSDEIHHAKGEIHRLVPRENPDVNKFWMCDEGRFTYKEVRVRRVAVSQLKGQVASFKSAISTAAKGLLSLIDAKQMQLAGIVLNAQASNEDNYVLAKVARALGIENVYLAGRPDQPDFADDILRKSDRNPNTFGARAIGEWMGKPKTTAQLADDLNRGALKALWMLGDHIALDERAVGALDRLEVAIYQSPHENFISEHVSVLLPASGWAEIDGTVTNFKGITQRLRASVEPPGEARPHHELIAMVAAELGVAIEYPNTKSIFFEMSKTVPAFGHASFGREAPPIQLRFAGSRG